MTDILTVTLNPAVDIATSTALVLPTHKLRCDLPQQHPGGGGINVARVAQRLNARCAALYPAGGATGARLRQLLDGEGVNSICLPIEGETRESFSVSESSSGREYRFVMPGPTLLASEWQACLDRIEALAPHIRYLVVSGSLPPGVPDDFYASLIRRVRPWGVRVVLDSSGPALAAALAAGVYLVKPSLRELRELCGQPLVRELEWCAAAEQLVLSGQADVVVLTLGEAGAWLVTRQEACFAPGLPVKVVGAIGAGDSFVGAMVWALAQGLALKEAFRYGVAAGTASLSSNGTGLCRPAEVFRWFDAVKLCCRASETDEALVQHVSGQ